MHSTIKNKIIHFYFNLTRKKEQTDLEALSILLDEILILLKTSLYDCDDTIEIDMFLSYFILLYKLIAYTRDITEGKGERDLAYMMMDIWYKHFPILTNNMLETISNTYGSWKDLKYFCKYTKNEECINFCIELWNNQLEKDITDITSSNVCKWIPREKSAFGWLFEKSAEEWYNRVPLDSGKKHIKKDYRKLLSFLNKKIDTPQIKQTQQNWSGLKPENVSVTTLSKQYHTFMEKIECPETFFSKKSENPMKNQKSFHLGEYIKNPHIQNQKYWNIIKNEILQKREKNQKLNILPMINISVDEYYDAVGIGCMLSEISAIKDRILVYDENASWIKISECDLPTKIKRIKAKTVIKNKTNILKAIQLIQNATPYSSIDANLIIIIISDFTTEPPDLDKKINEIFTTKNIKIIYWNIGSKISNIQIPENNLMVSGTSSSTIHYLHENIDNIPDAYSLITTMINNDRYKKVEEYFQTKIMYE